MYVINAPAGNWSVPYRLNARVLVKVRKEASTPFGSNPIGARLEKCVPFNNKHNGKSTHGVPPAETFRQNFRFQKCMRSEQSLEKSVGLE